MTVIPSRQPPDILIRCDASERIGGGHLIRCLALAEALRDRGARVRFVAALIPDFLAQRIAEAGFALDRLVPQDELTREGADWERTILSPEAQMADCAATFVIASAPDCVILDHYRLSRPWIKQVPQGCRKMVIDDLANRLLSADLLVDQTAGRTMDAYGSQLDAPCRMLLGSRYALLGGAYPAWRARSLERRRLGGPVKRILVAMGLMDLGGNSLPVVRSLREAGAHCDIDLAIGPAAASLPALRELAAGDPRLHLHVDSRNVAALMAAADLAVGAPGTSSWERCCLGLPTIMLPLAANQTGVARALEAAGAALVIASAENAGAFAAPLLAGGRPLAMLSAAAAALVDGKGTARVADALLTVSDKQSVNLSLRLAREEDSETLWLWRNAPAVRDASRSRSAIAWSDHANWFDSKLRDDNTRLFIAELDSQPAGMVRFDQVGDRALVSIAVDEDHRGRGLGRRLLAESCNRYLKEVGPVTVLRAEVHSSNLASAKVFEAVGFGATAEVVAEFRQYRRSRVDER